MANTCVVVADGGRARFFTYQRRAAESGQAGRPELEELEDLANPEGLLMGRELFSHPSSGRTRAATAGVYDTDDHRGRHLLEIERRFARRLATSAGELVRRERAHRLVLAIEPALLGLLRPFLPATVPAGTSVVELAGDLSRHSLRDIHDLLVKRGALSL